MCGIAGYFGTALIPEERASACLALMQRRGPNAAGSYRHCGPTGRNVLLLHTRLSIIDLDAHANQPFAIDDHVLAYNGELYNYLELRAQLERVGCTFRTASDTEVLLQGLAAQGAAVLERCEGMWAFAKYEERTGTLLLSRDRFGEKPLYLYADGDGVYFGSEVKFIAALLGRRIEPNLDHLFRYLVNGYKSLYKTVETFHRGVRELTAGTWLEIGAGGATREQRYWQPRFEQDSDLGFDQAVEEVRAALIESMRLRLRADVPIAFCMSGGIDSNTLISIARRTFGYDVHGFTILNTDSRYDEREMLDLSVRELGIRHTGVTLDSKNFLERLGELVAHHDAPVYTISYYVHWLLMRAVAESGYRISVSGTAADELFTGYYDHHNLYLAAVRGDTALHSMSLVNWRRWVAPVVRNPFLADPEVFVRNPGLREHIFLDAEGFAGYLHRPWSEQFSEQRYSSDNLRNRMANELFHESVPVILHEDDLNAMYHSIENRSPFLDSNLFAVTTRIPTRHLVRDGMAKAVLRAAARGIVPDAILDNRRKVGFNAPVLELLDTKNPAVRDAVLSDSPIYQHVRRERVAALLDQSTLPNSASKFLFNFLCARFFLERVAA
jgi:asparagine synthase (glutamine-hydrolysing)